MENEAVFTLTKENIIRNAYDAMTDCSACLDCGLRKLAARARGAALEWEFILYFILGVEDSEWKNDDYNSMVARADAMDI